MHLDIYFKYFELADQFEAQQQVATSASGLQAGDLAGQVFSTGNGELETVESIQQESSALEVRRNVAWKAKLREFLRLCAAEERPDDKRSTCPTKRLRKPRGSRPTKKRWASSNASTR